MMNQQFDANRREGAPDNAVIFLPPAPREEVLGALARRLDFAHERGGAAADSIITLSPDGGHEIVARARGNIGYALGLLHAALPTDIELTDFILEHRNDRAAAVFRISGKRVSDFAISAAGFADWHGFRKHWATFNLGALVAAEERWSKLDQDARDILEKLRPQAQKIVSMFRETVAAECR